MDPNEALRRFLNALAKGDRTEAVEAITDLQQWIAKGGFLPTDPRKAAHEAGSQEEFQADMDTFDDFVSPRAANRAFRGRRE